MKQSKRRKQKDSYRTAVILGGIILLLSLSLLAIYRAFLTPVALPESTLMSAPTERPDKVATGDFYNKLALGDIRIGAYEGEPVEATDSTLIYEVDAHSYSILSAIHTVSDVQSIISTTMADKFGFSLSDPKTEKEEMISDTGYLYMYPAAYKVMRYKTGRKTAYAIIYVIQNKLMLVEVTSTSTSDHLADLKKLLDEQANTYDYIASQESGRDDLEETEGESSIEETPVPESVADVSASTDNISSSKDAAVGTTENNDTATENIAVEEKSALHEEMVDDDPLYEKYKPLLARRDIVSVDNIMAGDARIIENPDVSKYPMALSKKQIGSMSLEELENYVDRWAGIVKPDNDTQKLSDHKYFLTQNDYKLMLVDFKHALAGGNPGKLYLVNSDSSRKYYPDSRIETQRGHTYFLVPEVKRGEGWYVYYDAKGISDGTVSVSEAGGTE